MNIVNTGTYSYYNCTGAMIIIVASLRTTQSTFYKSLPLEFLRPYLLATKLTLCSWNIDRELSLK